MTWAKYAIFGGAAMLAGCNGQLDSIGRPPPMTAPGAPVPTIEPPLPERTALAPPPPPPSTVGRTGSLWQSGPKSLFGDRRARQRGDILTVMIEIEDEAEISNTNVAITQWVGQCICHGGLWYSGHRRYDSAWRQHTEPCRGTAEHTGYKR